MECSSCGVGASNVRGRESVARPRIPRWASLPPERPSRPRCVAPRTVPQRLGRALRADRRAGLRARLPPCRACVRRSVDARWAPRDSPGGPRWACVAPIAGVAGCPSAGGRLLPPRRLRLASAVCRRLPACRIASGVAGRVRRPRSWPARRACAGSHLIRPRGHMKVARDPHARARRRCCGDGAQHPARWRTTSRGRTVQAATALQGAQDARDRAPSARGGFLHRHHLRDRRRGRGRRARAPLRRDPHRERDPRPRQGRPRRGGREAGVADRRRSTPTTTLDDLARAAQRGQRRDRRAHRRERRPAALRHRARRAGRRAREARGATPGIVLRGAMGYEGHVMGIRDRTEREEKAHKSMDRLLSTVRMMRDEGLRCEIVSAGGTCTFDITGGIEGITEVQAGHLRAHGQQLPLRRTCRSSWRSRSTRPCSAARAPSSAPPTPASRRWPPTTASRRLKRHRRRERPLPQRRTLHDHAARRLHDRARRPHRALPPHIDPTINMHDVLYAVEGDEVVEVWPVAARGYRQAGAD